MIAETERLVIRPLGLEDARFLLRLLNQPSWIRFIGDKGVSSIADAERYVQTGPMETYRRYGFGMNLVATRNDAVPVGVCGLVKRESLPDPDLGFALLDEFAGRGYAFEAATAVMRHVTSMLGLPRLLAITTPDNDRSERLLERLGFRFERRWQAPDGGELKLYVAVCDASVAQRPGPPG